MRIKALRDRVLETCCVLIVSLSGWACVPSAEPGAPAPGGGDAASGAVSEGVGNAGGGADVMNSVDPAVAIRGLPAATEFDGPLGDAVAKQLETLRARDRDDQAWGDLAMLFHAHALHDEARLAYRVAQALDPEDSLWPHLLGLVCEALALPDEAIEALERSRELEEFDVVARAILGRLYQNQGNFDKARELFREAVTIDPKSVAARVGLGQLALRSDVLEFAEKNLKLALEEYPKCGPAHAALAELYQKKGDKDAAAFHRRWSRATGGRVPLPDQYMQRIESLGVAYTARIKQGKTAASEGRTEDAITHYRAAIELRPALPEPGRLLALALVAVGRFDDAIAEARRLTELPTELEEAWLTLARIHLNRRQIEQARVAIDEALALPSPGAAAHVAQGDLLRAQRRLEEAIAAYDRALAVAPEDPIAIVSKAGVLLALRAPREKLKADPALRGQARERARSALALSERALELQGDLERGYDLAGRSRMQLWELAETAAEKTAEVDAAVEHFRTLVTYFPYRKRGHVALMRALHAAGRNQDLFRAAQAAQQLWPDDPQFLRQQPGQRRRSQ